MYEGSRKPAPPSEGKAGLKLFSCHLSQATKPPEITAGIYSGEKSTTRLSCGGKHPQGISPFARGRLCRPSLSQPAQGLGLAAACRGSPGLCGGFPGGERLSGSRRPGWGTGDTALGVFCVRMTQGLPRQPPAQTGCAWERRSSSVCVCGSPPWGCGAAEDRGPVVWDPSCVTRASLAARVPPPHSSGQSRAQEQRSQDNNEPPFLRPRQGPTRLPYYSCRY